MLPDRCWNSAAKEFPYSESLYRTAHCRQPKDCMMLAIPTIFMLWTGTVLENSGNFALSDSVVETEK